MRVYGYTVVNTYPHLLPAFTQGFEYATDATVLESLGSPEPGTRSILRQVDLKTGTIRRQIYLDPAYFAEGATALNGKIYQVTWKHQIGFVYDATTFRQLGTFSYTGEGWGLTNDGTHLILSNGTNVLQFLHPDTFRVVRQIRVPSTNLLNALAYVDGTIYANIWFSDQIVCIDPWSGTLLYTIDLAPLCRLFKKGEHVLNGIAYDTHTQRLFVTGKNWPTIFEIRVHPSPRMRLLCRVTRSNLR